MFAVYAIFYMRVFALGTYAYMAHARDSKSIVLAHFFMGRLSCHIYLLPDIYPSSTRHRQFPSTLKKTRKNKYEAQGIFPHQKSH